MPLLNRQIKVPTAVITYSPFIVEKKSFIWASDGRYMNWPALIYIGNWLRELIANILNGTIAFKMFDLNLGMGADVIGTLNFFGFGLPPTPAHTLCKFVDKWPLLPGRFLCFPVPYGAL